MKMKVFAKIGQWMAKNLEEPFYRAELARAEMLREDDKQDSSKPGLAKNNKFAVLRAVK